MPLTSQMIGHVNGGITPITEAVANSTLGIAYGGDRSTGRKGSVVTRKVSQCCFLEKRKWRRDSDQSD